MKAVPVIIEQGKGYVPCPKEAATHVLLNFPGPSGHICLPVLLKGQRHGTNCWTWNGDTEKPTLRPSVLSKGNFTCHSWVNDGMVQFLGDCTHELKGQTLPLLDVEVNII